MNLTYKIIGKQTLKTKSKWIIFCQASHKIDKFDLIISW